MSDSSATALGEAVVRACVAAGRSTLPPELVGPVVAMLNRLVVDPVVRKEFQDAVEVATTAFKGPTTEGFFRGEDPPDIPDDEIIAGGFGVLTPEQLAELAIEPVVLDCIVRLVEEAEDEGLTGAWLWKVVGQNREVAFDVRRRELWLKNYYRLVAAEYGDGSDVGDVTEIGEDDPSG